MKTYALRVWSESHGHRSDRIQMTLWSPGDDDGASSVAGPAQNAVSCPPGEAQEDFKGAAGSGDVNMAQDSSLQKLAQSVSSSSSSGMNMPPSHVYSQLMPVLEVEESSDSSSKSSESSSCRKSKKNKKKKKEERHAKQDKKDRSQEATMQAKVAPIVRQLRSHKSRLTSSVKVCIPPYQVLDMNHHLNNVTDIDQQIDQVLKGNTTIKHKKESLSSEDVGINSSPAKTAGSAFLATLTGAEELVNRRSCESKQPSKTTKKQKS